MKIYALSQNNIRILRAYECRVKLSWSCGFLDFFQTLVVNFFQTLVVNFSFWSPYLLTRIFNYTLRKVIWKEWIHRYHWPMNANCLYVKLTSLRGARFRSYRSDKFGDMSKVVRGLSEIFKMRMRLFQDRRRIKSYLSRWI